MKRVAIIVGTALGLALVPAAQAQKKQKDPMLHQYLIEEFGALNAKLDRLAERVGALEAETTRLKQQQTDLSAELRNAQNILKATDTSLSSYRLSSQQDLFSLKTDLTQVRQDMARLADLITKGATPSPPGGNPTMAEAPPLEGYITAVSDREVTINLGANANVRVGSEFSVFRANDPRTQIGIIEVVEVMDGNNSRAKIVYTRPGLKLEFSDMVRPR